MKDEQFQKFRPLMGRLIVGGIAEIILSVFLTCLCIYRPIDKCAERTVVICIIVCVFLYGIKTILVSVYKWDATVYIGDKGMMQKQWNNMVVISYDAIREVKVVYSYAHMEHLLEIYGDEGVIVMRLFRCFDCFMKRCTNTEVIKEINKQMDARGIIRDC